MICDVRIFIESTYKGPSKRRGVVMWLVEAQGSKGPVTREGELVLEEATETGACLQAIAAAAGILNRSCNVKVYTKCMPILNAMQSAKYTSWMQKGYITQKGQPLKYADDWMKMVETLNNNANFEFLSEKHEYQTYMQDHIRKVMEACNEQQKQQDYTDG